MILVESGVQYTLQAIFSGISIACCSVVVISFIAFKNLRKSAARLVLFLCISEIIYSLAMLMRPPNLQSNIICGAQIFTSNFGHISTLVWTCMITHTLRRSVEKGYDFVKKIMPKVIAFSILLPLLLASCILTRQYFFTDSQFCEVLSEAVEGTSVGFSWQRLLMLIEFQLPIYISMAFNLKIIKKVAAAAKEHGNDSSAIQRLFIYPFIIPICQMFALLYQLLVLFGTNPDSLNGLLSLHLVFSCSQGAVNSIVYGFNEKLKINLKTALKSRKNSSTSIGSSLLSNESSISFKSSSKQSNTKGNNKQYQPAARSVSYSGSGNNINFDSSNDSQSEDEENNYDDSYNSVPSKQIKIQIEDL